MLYEHDAVRREPLREDAEVRQLRDAGERRRGAAVEPRAKTVGERAVPAAEPRLQRHPHDALRVAACAFERRTRPTFPRRKNRKRIGIAEELRGPYPRVRSGVGAIRQIRRVEVQRDGRAGRKHVAARRRPRAGGEIGGADRYSLLAAERLSENVLDGRRDGRDVRFVGIERVGIDRDRVRLIGDAVEVLRRGRCRRNRYRVRDRVGVERIAERDRRVARREAPAAVGAGHRRRHDRKRVVGLHRAAEGFCRGDVAVRGLDAGGDAQRILRSLAQLVRRLQIVDPGAQRRVEQLLRAAAGIRRRRRLERRRKGHAIAAVGKRRVRGQRARVNGRVCRDVEGRPHVQPAAPLTRRHRSESAADR